MSIEDNIDINALGQAIDSTWGRSSTPKTASYSVKMLLKENFLLVSYASIVTFGTERQMIDTKRAYASEADSVVVGTIKRVKEIYKELAGKALPLKLVKGSECDSVEIINLNVHTAKRTAYYRRKVMYTFGE